jgi:hypothetical protein
VGIHESIQNEQGARVREQTHISNSHRVRSTTARGCESLESPCDTLDASAGIRPRLRFSLAALVSLAVLIFVLATSAAEATRYQRPFKEDFGTTAQPTFDEPSTLAVDRANGDLLVGERGTDSISRFNPDGTPAPFSALGTNVIDGKPGPGGKPCTEEPASCDQTPQGGLEIQGQDTTGIAIDESGGPTNGDI